MMKEMKCINCGSRKVWTEIGYDCELHVCEKCKMMSHYIGRGKK